MTHSLRCFSDVSVAKILLECLMCSAPRRQLKPYLCKTASDPMAFPKVQLAAVMGQMRVRCYAKSEQGTKENRQ
jgi:hypothetical protein